MSLPSGLALAADGSVGAVATDQGQLSFVSPVVHCPVLRRDGATAQSELSSSLFVSSIRRRSRLVTVVNRQGPRFFPEGHSCIQRREGYVCHIFDLEQPTTWTPSIDTTYGVPYFAGHTPRKRCS
jgi:hypothetical protein